MVAMYEQPDKVHRFLDTVCDSNIRYMRTLLEKAGRVDGNIWPYVWLPHRLGVMLTADMMPLLSPELYKEFGLPPLKRLSDEFGGLFIHCCGQWARHAANLAESGVKIRGIEFHHPFTALEEIQDYFPDTVLVPYLANFVETAYADWASFVEAMLKVRRPRTRLCFALTDTHPELAAIRDVLDRHGFRTERYVE